MRFYIIFVLLINLINGISSIKSYNLIKKKNFNNLNTKNKYSIPALITPMKSDFSIDYNKFEQLVNYHLDKSDSLTILGSTGEWTSINNSERNKLIKIASNTINGKIPLIVGTGDINTDKTIQNCLESEKYGGDINLIISPFYTRPSQSGIIDNYNFITKNTNLPIIIYDCPSRTNSEMEISTIQFLSFNDKIIGIKDATGDIQKLKILKEKCHSEFIFLSGDDLSSLEYCLEGGNGCISVVANLIPELYYKIMKLSNYNQTLSSKYFDTIKPLINTLNSHTNPVSIKYATYKKMNLEGLWDSLNYGIRRPLNYLSDFDQSQINDLLSSTIEYEDKLNY